VLLWVMELAILHNYQIILQSIFMIKKYELKNISKFVINILSWAECHFNNSYVLKDFA
jgi:hypothetical protein